MAMRLSGLMSGMDTDSVIQELVSARKTKVDKEVKAQTKLEWKQDAAATYIVNDQKREYLVVTELTDNLYDSVTVCEAPEGEPAERWSDWLEVLPALESDGEYWSFCYPVTRVTY